uniref:Uncharacterized protein n=1 Tax=Sinocyclocheilus anshuiensis TaxID=1608454 RepID=A0A671KRM2_9TELE
KKKIQLSARLYEPQYSCSRLIFITYAAWPRQRCGQRGSFLIGWVDGGKRSCWLHMQDMDLMQSQVSTRGQELLNLKSALRNRYIQCLNHSHRQCACASPFVVCLSLLFIR